MRIAREVLVDVAFRRGGELRRAGLAEDEGAGGAERADDGRVDAGGGGRVVDGGVVLGWHVGGEDDVFDADGEAVEGAALGRGERVEFAGAGEDLCLVEVDPGFDFGVARVDSGEEGFGVGFDCDLGGEEEGEDLGGCLLPEVGGLGVCEVHCWVGGLSVSVWLSHVLSSYDLVWRKKGLSVYIPNLGYILPLVLVWEYAFANGTNHFGESHDPHTDMTDQPSNRVHM